MSIRYFPRIAFLAIFIAISWLPSPLLAHSHLRAKVAATSSDVFPEPPGLRDAVQFWRQVFGIWNKNQVALHDNEYLGAIYEVIDLPPSQGDGLTPEQTQLIKVRRETLENKLSAVEQRIRQGLPLDSEQHGLYDTLVKSAGKFAVYGAARRVRQQRGMRERFLEGLRTSGRYDMHLREVFRNARLPEDLAYLPHIESSFVNHSRSNVGAAGVWQFMRSTGKLYLLINEAVDERYDPVLAARGAARYLGGAYQRLGDWGLAITSYNHGINGMADARARYGTDIDKIVRYYQGRLFGFASRNFYAEFLAVRSIISDLKQYFPAGVRLDSPIDHARVRLMVSATLPQLADHYGVATGLVQTLNPALTQGAADGHVPLPSGTQIWLPKHAVQDSGSMAIYTGRSATNALEKPIDQAPRTIKSNRQSRETKHKSRPVKYTTARRTKVHVVRKGESPYGIARRYGLTVAAMMNFNALRSNTTIRPGQKLRIPIK